MDGGQREVCGPEATPGRGLRARLSLRLVLWPLQPRVPALHGHRQVHGRPDGAYYCRWARMGRAARARVRAVVRCEQVHDIPQFARASVPAEGPMHYESKEDERQFQVRSPQYI